MLIDVMLNADRDLHLKDLCHATGMPAKDVRLELWRLETSQFVRLNPMTDRYRVLPKARAPMRKHIPVLDHRQSQRVVISALARAIKPLRNTEIAEAVDGNLQPSTCGRICTDFWRAGVVDRLVAVRKPGEPGPGRPRWCLPGKFPNVERV